jgi:hypothetical protein
VTRFTIVLRGSDGASLELHSSSIRRDSLNEFSYSPGGVLDPEFGFIADPWPGFLFDREGSVSFELWALPGDDAPSFYRGEIQSAKLVIVGTAVPSPSTAGSILLGLAMLSAIGRARRQIA